MAPSLEPLAAGAIMTHSLLWFRRDLRLSDNPALLAAVQDSNQLLPVYLHCPEEEAPWAPGAASRWWCHHSLGRLQSELRRRGSELYVLPARDSARTLLRLCRESGCERVIYNRLPEPHLTARDHAVNETLAAAGIETLSFPANLLAEPGSLHNKQGGPYRVFTPFWKSLQPMLDHLGQPQAAPLRLPALPYHTYPTDIDGLKLLPEIDWTGGLEASWSTGEAAAHEQLDSFLDQISAYGSDRDRPDRPGTSRLSPYLHFGELSIRQVVHAARYSPQAEGSLDFQRELAWREFAHHLLHHFPDTPTEPLNPAFKPFPWRRASKDLKAWQQGRTGIPMVDAGMRELWHSGWMHNRVRMIVASFLTKHLRISWQQGAAWFWDTLVDASLANNTLGWQWTAGCGADAAPYFRVFNPVLQGKKFDPKGAYIRRWLPELRDLPDKLLYSPWEKPSELERAGLRLGKHYPRPIVDLAEGRDAALAAYQTIRKS